ncbi:MAG TPA: cupin domain-containing protein [Nitrospiraceae bacterium]|nr:cupin domain-containing protein [Nitrospiraceae bacterium]
MTSAKDIIEMLGLTLHPTCGFVAETYRNPRHIPQQALPAGYEASRPFGSVLYFLVTPDVQIRLHRIRPDQMYHHYLGAPLEVLLLYPDGTGEIAVVGPHLAAGMRPQLFIPSGTFHISRLRRGSDFALLGTTEWPAFEPPDLELGDPNKLVMEYPALRHEIQDFVGQSTGSR